MISYFDTGLQVVVQDISWNSQISIVEWVSVVPALCSKLLPLTHTGMKVTQWEHQSFKLLLPRTHFQSILQNRNDKVKNKWTVIIKRVDTSFVQR